MLRIEVRFPLGVYHALSNARFGAPEWPPSPVRLIGALLAAAHEAPGADTDAARGLLERICAADPPVIVAPAVIGPDEPSTDGKTLGTDIVVALRGASRWAPRNHSDSEVKSSGLSPRNLARERTEVHKGGVAIGDRPVEIHWPDLDLDDDERRLLNALLDELTFLGTSRSPVIARALGSEATLSVGDQWKPSVGSGRGDAEVRVPNPGLLRAFDQRHEARRSTGKKAVATGEHVPGIAMGNVLPYVLDSRRLAAEAAEPLDPRQWGEMLVLELDPGPETAEERRDERARRENDKPPRHSQLRPKAAAGFLLARAFREALLGAYTAIGTDGEAPPVLRGHGDEPHAAIVPLPFVGTIVKRSKRDEVEQQHRIPADGIVRGIAVLLPHEDRVADVAAQAERVRQGLMQFVGVTGRRWIDVPNAGRVFLRAPNPNRPLLQTLRDARYRRASRVWETVLPVVHAHRRTSTGPRGLLRQIAKDCSHVGLPDPIAVEVLEHAPLGGAPDRLWPDRLVPPDWRGPLDGPRSHLRITFERPVIGPLVLGRARHFGVGLCLPNVQLAADVEESAA
ncbi:type I-G CRISPR-associated protein Csb2 [Patulibacter defluvii]|uniref:type I-G CRISPR-associated protein Csb2 n=1 Tax=Patulibacter defluvii TaxID=3095358 RepID=UPI002A74CD55|nr:type I-U CRISPR-associated protein Csb2 [Patulibacter sp. DM4]